ncbi:unnamed protein product, partial [Laminaria digitata]
GDRPVQQAVATVSATGAAPRRTHADGTVAPRVEPTRDDSALSRQLGRGLAVMLAPAVLLLLADRWIRWKKTGRLRKASSLRVAKAEQTLARLFSAAARRHRDVQQKAAILEQALSRRAAARR